MGLSPRIYSLFDLSADLLWWFKAFVCLLIPFKRCQPTLGVTLWLFDVKLMGFTVEHPFTFPQGKFIRVIFSNHYENNYVSPGSATKLSLHREARSFCYYKEDQ